jgi:lysophospholipase L1-like esterase
MTGPRPRPNRRGRDGHPRPGRSRRGRLVLVVAVALVAVVLLGGSVSYGAGGRASAAELQQARAVLSRTTPAVVSVLGDSTGNDPGEWVDLWAADLGATRRVTLHQWDTGTKDWKPAVVRYGTAGQQLTIWNGSQNRAQAADPIMRLARFQPERPDLVLYSFGHNNNADTIVDGLQATIDADDEHWNARLVRVVILQNPSRQRPGEGQQRTLRAVDAWATRTGQPTIDVTAAFRASSTDLPALLMDDLHPNAAGSRVWAGAVADALS